MGQQEEVASIRQTNNCQRHQQDNLQGKAKEYLSAKRGMQQVPLAFNVR